MTIRTEADLEKAMRGEVRDAITLAGYTQVSVAEKLGLSQKHLSAMLTGKVTMSVLWAGRIMDLCKRELLISSRRKDPD